MYFRYVSAFCIAFLMTISSPAVLIGQSSDSLLYLLNNNLAKDDSAKYYLLRNIISNTTDFNSKLQYCDQAIKLAEKINFKIADTYVLKGTFCLDAGYLYSALECFINAANYYKENGNNIGLARAYMLMAETYSQQDNFDNEKYYLQNVIDIYKKEKDTILLAYALSNLGYANYDNGQYDTALVLFTKTGDLFYKLDSVKEYAYCLGNSGLAYSKMLVYDKAEDYLTKAIEILTNQGGDRAIPEFIIGYAGILENKGDIRKAIVYAKQGLDLAFKNGTNEYVGDAAQMLAHIYQISGMYDSAFYYQSLYINANDSIKNLTQKMAKLTTDFEVTKAQTEVDTLQKNKLIQRIIILGLIVILLLALGLILLYYSSLKKSRKMTAELEERRALLEKQSSELKEKNDKIIKANEELKQLYEITNSQKEEIISSISYAQRIQQAILPPEGYITELINENFILHKPKEIVSGDFYWIKQINQYVILAAADCTGHGVPGALMSMLGISSLNEIVQRKQITQANQILNELRKEIKHSLRQTGKKEESRDGIDMAVCVIDTNQSLMQYAGAFCPLYVVSKIDGSAVINEIQPDLMPVGVHVSSDISFTNHEIKLDIGDTFYLSTDGFIDQVGGSNNTRFGSKNLKKLLLEIHDQPLYEQKEILEQSLIDWMGNHTQRDDILVIGARV